MEEGKLPVKYLGVPLIASSLKNKDCNILLDRVDKRIKNWKSKYLSFAGRLQLIKSVLAAMHIYWASVFLLSPGIDKGIERKMRDFLWQKGETDKGKAKIAWKDCCRPKDEGGIGITRITDMNKALITSLIWKIVTKKKSIWVKWTHENRIKNKNFWELPIKQGMARSWKDILRVRDCVRANIKMKIGDGNDTNAWYDNWSKIGPIAYHISYRNITRAGFNEFTRVKDIINNQCWNWPNEWENLLPERLTPPKIESNGKDETIWVKRNGEIEKFSVSNAWDSIRTQNPKVNWFKAVWYAQAIPRHAFHVWLVVNKRLQTQDRMANWSGEYDTNSRLQCCSLCKTGPDSHSHLFFECSFAKDVWCKVKEAARLQWLPDKWEKLEDILIKEKNSSKVKAIICKLIIAASSYYIWRERNKRLFTEEKCDQVQIAETIISTIRLRLASCKFWRKNTGFDVLNYWKNVR